MNSTLQRERDLFQNRPRSRFLRFSGALLTLAVAATWMSGEVALGEVFSERRAENLQRFLSEELTIASIATGEHTFASWCLDLWNSKGAEAVGTTFWLSVLAMLLAGVFGWLTAPLGASNLMTREPMHGPSRGSSLNPWSLCAQATRLLQVLLRAIPEYVWAFFLLAVLGPGAWPAILALAIHNAGILGRLGSDTFENLSPRPLQSLFQLGASRSQVAVSAGAAGTFPRFLLYFFYRWETCIREATVLGMLGIVSLGYWVVDARVRQNYDEMVFLIGLGSILVILGDLVSSWARRHCR